MWQRLVNVIGTVGRRGGCRHSTACHARCDVVGEMGITVNEEQKELGGGAHVFTRLWFSDAACGSSSRSKGRDCRAQLSQLCGLAAAPPPRFTVIHRGGARMECGARTCTRRRGLDEVRRCFRRGLNRPGNGTQLARWKRFNKLRLKGQDPPFFTVSPATNHSPVVFFSVAVFISSGSAKHFVWVKNNIDIL